jgi:hypothetical protein
VFISASAANKIAALAFFIASAAAKKSCLENQSCKKMHWGFVVASNIKWLNVY